MTFKVTFYLLHPPDVFPQGCSAFKPISPNVEKEESGIKDDSGMQDVQYNEVRIISCFPPFGISSSLTLPAM